MNFNIGHCPVGSVVEFEVIHREPVVGTVTKIHRTGPNNWILETDRPGTVTDFESYNLQWVKRIIKRGPGKASSIKEIRNYACTNNFEVEAKIRKHKSQYMFYHSSDLVKFLATAFLDDTKYLDGEKLVNLLHARNLLKFHQLSDKFVTFGVYKVNKKKLKRAVKQLLPKCLLKLGKTQKEMDDRDADIYYKDMESELNFELDSEYGSIELPI